MFGCRPQAGQQSNVASGVPVGGRILLKGGTVISMDPDVGDFETADVLIDGSSIAAVGPDLEASAEVVDASNMIVMPGFVDTHRHMWQGQLRNILPDGLLSDYRRDITGAARDVFRPQDAYIGDLVIALGAINAGVTTCLDWSHIGNSPEHTDGAIEGLRESGIRGVYAFGSGAAGPENQFPQDIRRLRAEHFSSDDQLLTLALAAGPNSADWAVAREVGAPVTIHMTRTGQLPPLAGAMGPDVTYIHVPNLLEQEWQLLADTGGHVSISAPIEMEMGHGIPPVQQALDHGIRPSLSTDQETEMREVMEFATIQGAIDNGLGDKIGTLTPGKEADIIMLQMDAINVMPVNNAYGAVLLGMDTSNVDTVFIGGQAKKWRGELLGVDLDRIRSLVNESRDYVLAAAGWPQTFFGGYLPGH
jgi:cytosine/adenosine deaminase-related metal-dependent hydrolase